MPIWISLADQEPDEEKDIVLISENGDYWTGRYHGNGLIRVVSRAELQDDGSFRQSTTGLHKSYFTHWMYLGTRYE